MNAAAYVVAPITALVSNDDETVEIERLELTIKSSEEPKTATLERVWIDDPRPRAGRTVPLKVLLRTYRGEDVLRTVPIEIPANAQRQPVGAGLRRTAARRRPSSAKPRVAAAAKRAAAVRALNKGRRNNTLYVKLLERRRRRGRQRRAAVVAAAVGAGRARSRPQRRQLQPAPQRDARRVGDRRPSTP